MKHANSPPKEIKQPFFSYRNFPVIQKKLAELVKACKHRKFTGTMTTAPCCQTEGGQVFECKLYGHKPAVMYDCLNCQKKIAIEGNATWITPLVMLSQGRVPPMSLAEVQRLAASDNSGR